MQLDSDRDHFVKVDELVETAKYLNIVPGISSSDDLKSCLIWSGAAIMDFTSYVSWMKFGTSPSIEDKGVDETFKKLIDCTYSKFKLVKSRFEGFDKLNDDTVSVDDFQKTLQSMNIKLPTWMLEKVTSHFDKGGRINWKSFLLFVQEFNSSSANKDKTKIGLTAHEFLLLGEMFELFFSQSKSYYETFQNLDKNKDDLISLDEFRKGVEQLGLHNFSYV